MSCRASPSEVHRPLTALQAEASEIAIKSATTSSTVGSRRARVTRPEQRLDRRELMENQFCSAGALRSCSSSCDALEVTGAGR
jgi:hypothetical protein